MVPDKRKVRCEADFFALRDLEVIPCPRKSSGDRRPCGLRRGSSDVVFVLSAAFAVAVLSAAVVLLFERLDFLFGHRVRFHHFDFEVERLSGEFVVHVNGDVFLFDFLDSQGNRASRRLRVEDHSRLDFFCLERFLGNGLHQLGIVFAIAFARRDVDRELVPDFFVGERLFEPADYHAASLDVAQRFLARRRVDDVSRVILERVMDGDFGVVCDCHGVFLF